MSVSIITERVFGDVLDEAYLFYELNQFGDAVLTEYARSDSEALTDFLYHVRDNYELNTPSPVTDIIYQYTGPARGSDLNRLVPIVNISRLTNKLGHTSLNALNERQLEYVDEKLDQLDMSIDSKPIGVINKVLADIVILTDADIKGLNNIELLEILDAERLDLLDLIDE